MTLWLFDRISSQDPARAACLQSAPPSADIDANCCAALRRAVEGGNVRIGFDQSSRDPRHVRPVVQFPVSQQLFDWFFNSHSGYRAQFRVDWAIGHRHNMLLVELLRMELEDLRHTMAARLLNASFEDIGPKRTSAREVVSSLDPHLSKVWFCKKLIGLDGVVTDLGVELSGPRLVFDEFESWAAPIAEEGHSWLDLKGAFLGDDGLYQLKDPVVRAQDLQRLGSA